ncbi:helix-turn-helix domain-containing protein [Piscinibacter sp.]|uniref:helix-turn-helix domain-containing protein n=1 Tax=Piscinibacter sp. TaxID=1903157 RepID=UPI0039E482F3
MNNPSPSVGELLRGWRQRRRLSQLALAVDAEVSQRHLSFVESGRSQPSREMLLRLAERLSVPVRERNAMLVAAGFAPLYRERPLGAPELASARDAVERILQGHAPHPALAVDRHWNLLAANRSVYALLGALGAPPPSGPVNVLRLTLHPEGLAGRVLNLAEWREHLLVRLAHDVERSADPVLAALLEELKSYPAPPRPPAAPAADGRIAVPFRLAGPDGPLSFISATTVFGTAVDVTLAELTIEAFFPADADTAATMARLA